VVPGGIELGNTSCVVRLDNATSSAGIEGAEGVQARARVSNIDLDPMDYCWRYSCVRNRNRKSGIEIDRVFARLVIETAPSAIDGGWSFRCACGKCVY